MKMDEIKLAPDFAVPVDIFTSAVGLLGIRGSGKTTTAGVLVEEAIGIGVPTVIIDPTGAWFGLKSSADGKSAGLPVFVFGGEHADVPLEPDAGEIVGRFLVEKRVPTVLDLSLMSKTKQVKFVADLLEVIYHTNREPLLVVIDETARFCPQNTRGTMSPDIGRCIGAVDDIGALGRRKGLGIIIIGQRASRVNKDVLSQCDSVIVMRSSGPQDRKALQEWVKEQQGDDVAAATFLRDLTTLAVGEGYVWSPAFLQVFRKVQFRNRRTFDSSATPKIGQRVITPQAFAKVDLGALTAELQSVRERSKADDPKALHARIAELERELAAAPSKAEPAAVPEPQPFLTPRDEQHLEIIVARSEGTMRAIEALPASIERLAEKTVAELRDYAQRLGAVLASVNERFNVTAAPVMEKAATPIQVEAKPRAFTPSESVTISKPDGKFLEVLARRDGAATTRRQLGALAGYSPKSSTFANYVSSLRTRGFIDVQGDIVRITPAGRDACGAPAKAKPLTAADTLAAWERMLGGKPAVMLRILFEQYPRDLTRSELAERAALSPTSSTFANYLSELRTNKLAIVKGQVVQANAAELML